MGEPLLAFEGVVLRSEEGKVRFQGLDWTVEHGAKVNLRSISGRDAAALLGLAAGLLQPHEGRVLLEGVPLGSYAFDHPFLQRGAVGWVPRDGGLLVNQSLLANVTLPLRFTKGMGRIAAEEMAAKALEEAGLAEVANQRPHLLDPRERWLGALVRAGALAPDLWLMDQPPGTLNPRMLKATSIILDRAVASPAAMVVVGIDSWIPRHTLQGIGLKDGKLQPEDM